MESRERDGKAQNSEELYPNDPELATRVYREGAGLYSRCMRDPMNASLLSMRVCEDDRRIELGEGHLSNYAQVKALMIKAGGVYRDSGFFDFQESATDIMDMLLRGEEKNDKKKFQAFFTPSELASELVEWGCIDSSMRVLEPSAGGGAIADEIQSYGPKELVCCELWRRNVELLESKGHTVVMGDFLDQTVVTLGGKFDCIVANPPFTKNQDIDHVYHMYDLLKEGGRMIAVMSRSWVEDQIENKKISVIGWIVLVSHMLWHMSTTRLMREHLVSRELR